VNCQCQGGHIPDIRRLDVASHAAFVWDECDPRPILTAHEALFAWTLLLSARRFASGLHVVGVSLAADLVRAALLGDRVTPRWLLSFRDVAMKCPLR
jgi:hypothetical protein